MSVARLRPLAVSAAAPVSNGIRVPIRSLSIRMAAVHPPRSNCKSTVQERPVMALFLRSRADR